MINKLFSLIVISIILVLVPLKILSYGWSPNYAMLISSVLTQDSSLPFSQESIKESIEKNKPLYNSAKEYNLVIIVLTTFILFNIIGLCSVENRMAWFVAISVLMLSNDSFIKRLLGCSPQLVLCMLLMSLVALFADYIKERPKSSTFALILYIFALRSIVPPEIYAIDTFNVNYSYICSSTIIDLRPFLVENCWMFFALVLLILDSYKRKIKLFSQLDDSLLFVSLLLQLLINFGYNDLCLFRDSILVLWFSYKISELIKFVACFKEFRVKFCLSIFVFALFFLLATHDNGGRYSKHTINTMPIDFSMKELREWKPEAGGILYNDNADIAFSQYYENPEAYYSYIYLNSFALFEKEKENILNIKRMLTKKEIPLPEYYENWVAEMKPEDRLLTSSRINGLENIEWLQCGRKLWIGKLKTSNILSEDNLIE